MPQHVAATFFQKILIDFNSWMPRRACFQVYLCVSCCAVFSTSRGNVHAEESSPPRPPPPPPPGDHADWPEAFDESELGAHYSSQRTQIKFKQIFFFCRWLLGKSLEALCRSRLLETYHTDYFRTVCVCLYYNTPYLQLFLAMKPSPSYFP